MKVTVYRQPCYLHEATELVHAFVNQIPVEELSGRGPYCIPVEEILRIKAEACEGLDPDSEEMQFFFSGFPFEDKASDLTSIACYIVYSWASEIISDVDEMVEHLVKDWKDSQGRLRVDNLSRLGMGTFPDETGKFHSVAKEISRLPIPVAQQMQMVEMLSNYEYYLRRLVDLLRPVIEKLKILLAPWIRRAEPLMDQWQDSFASEDYIEGFIMQYMALQTDQPEELRICPRFLQPNGGYACILKNFKIFNLYNGVGYIFTGVKPDAEKKDFADADYMTLRLLGNSDRMSMLRAMMAAPMTAQEVAHKLELHSGSVFRDLNSMSNCNLLIREVLNGKRHYRTNYPLLQNLFQKILQVLEEERNI